jgi:hypothetical protein
LIIPNKPENRKKETFYKVAPQYAIYDKVQATKSYIRGFVRQFKLKG